jgi:hypothetical protein
LNSEQNAKPDALNTDDFKQDSEDFLSNGPQDREQEEIKQDIGEKNENRTTTAEKRNANEQRRNKNVTLK